MLNRKAYRRIFLLGVALLIQGCASFQPTDLHYDSVKTEDMPFAVEYGVYTPPGWTEQESLPMILFLHGGGDSHVSFEKHGGNDYFDEQINAGNMPRVILVTPNGRFGLWENWANGRRLYRDWIQQQILPEVTERFNVKRCPEHCHLMGISLGGYGVMRFAHFANDQFSSVSVVSAPIVGEEDGSKPKTPIWIRMFLRMDRIFGDNYEEKYVTENPYNAWLNEPGLADMRLQLIWGDNDTKGVIRSNRKFHEFLKRKNRIHDAYEYQGNHKWVSWKPTFNRVVNFLVNSNS